MTSRLDKLAGSAYFPTQKTALVSRLGEHRIQDLARSQDLIRCWGASCDVDLVDGI